MMHDRLDLAIWLEPVVSELRRADDGIQAHLNFWKLPEGAALDIGIDVPFMKAGTINIFIATDKNVCVKNLFPLLQDDKLLHTLFNEVITSETCPDQTMCMKATHPAQDACNPSTFCLCCLEDGVLCRDAYGGKLIEIDVANASCTHACRCQRQYVRLRLTGEAITESYRKKKIPYSNVDYYTSRLEFIDFRLNNVRSLPTTLLETVKTYPKLSKVRCFLMLDLESNEKLILPNKYYKKVRILEKEKWDRYLPHPAKVETAILAYQWNSDTEKQSFSLFIGIKSNYYSCRTVVIFLAMLFLPSLISSYIWEKMSAPSCKVQIVTAAPRRPAMVSGREPLQCVFSFSPVTEKGQCHLPPGVFPAPFARHSLF